MTRQRCRLSAILAGITLAAGPQTFSQTQTPATTAGSVRTEAIPQDRADVVVLRALLSNPITAPYRISTSLLRDGRVVLSGRVGTLQIHDAAVRTAIALGYPIRDDIKIDTAEVYRAAAMTRWNQASGMAQSLGANPYYVYPPPLFGRLDDPFYGFEPPIISYPPWFRSLSARNQVAMANTMASGPTAPAVVTNPLSPYGQSVAAANDPAAAPPALGQQAQGPVDGVVEMTINPQGQAVLRGTVPSMDARVAVGQKIAQTPGVTEVVNLLDVAEKTNDAPPPPPQPAAAAPEVPANPAPAPAGAQDALPPLELEAVQPTIVPDDKSDLGDRLKQAFSRRPALANQPIKVVTRDGVAYLSGKVPTIYEAMLAYRAVQQTPGVRELDDRLEFVVPDDEHKNPLIQKGRPEDVEPYLTAQIRRQIGDLAHIDQVRISGGALEIHGTIRRDDDRARLEATLRSMPVLRGFKIDTNLTAE